MLDETEVTAVAAVLTQSPPQQQSPIVVATLDDHHRSDGGPQSERIVAAASIAVMDPPATTTTATATLPYAVAAICNPATKASLPTAHARQILPPITTPPTPTLPPSRPHFIATTSMNAAIDRTVALSQQRRAAMIAEGTVIVEDSSSIQIDLDRVDAFYQNLERRDFIRRFVFKYFRMGIYFMGMGVAWIIATPLFFQPCASLGLHDLHFTPAFPLALLPYLLIVMCGMQPLGAVLMYWTHRLGEEMLPRRNGRGTLTQVLLSGACCFCDNVLSREQFWRLLAVQVVNVAGFYLCGAASIMAVFGLAPNILDDDKFGTFLFLWALLSVPAWAWYRLIQYLHLHFVARRRCTNPSYNVVATADAVIDEPDASTTGSATLELV